MFERFQNNIIYFFSKEDFDKQHQAKTWFEIKVNITNVRLAE